MSRNNEKRRLKVSGHRIKRPISEELLGTLTAEVFSKGKAMISVTLVAAHLNIRTDSSGQFEMDIGEEDAEALAEGLIAMVGKISATRAKYLIAEAERLKAESEGQN